MMKKILSIIAIAALILSTATFGYSAPSGVVNVTVTIEKTLSIDITGGPIDLGTLGVGETAVSASAINIANDGSGAEETLTLSVSDPAGWTQGTPGVETYRISFQFSADGQGATWLDAGSVSESLSYNETKNLWIQLETPTATSVVTQQTIPVTITAE